MDQSDDVSFRVNFAGDGVAKLRDRVKDKLKEFMGDYTDDTLVEYVIVLLKNGRRKVEARNELNVFLGDDSDTFVSWLWDHLGQNLDLYVQKKDVVSNAVAKTKSTSKEQAENIDSHHKEAEHEREKPTKVSRSRHGRDWKDIVKNADETPALRSVVTANIHADEVAQKKLDYPKRSPSPRPILQKKRRHPDEMLEMKKDEVPKITINAPRRLLQFAVRDAVGSPRSSSLSTEPSSKRLRSVVSTPLGDSSLGDRSQRIQSVARAPNASMAVAIKAVAEAAKDVVKVRSSGNVFDRLGRGTDISDTFEHMEQSIDASAKVVDEYVGFDYVSQETRSTHLQRDGFDEHYPRNRTLFGSYAGIASNLVPDDELYEDARNIGHNAMDVSYSGTSGGNKDDDSLMLHYSVAAKADESTPEARNDRSYSAAAITSSKIINISVNGNTWKPPHYQETGKLSSSSRKILHEVEAGASKSGAQLMKENNNPVSVGNGNAIPAAGVPNESQKGLSSTIGSYSAGRLVEDADSRTIFVTNVHFAATKDSLSRHFNKFGDVLKVVIVTDAATGQPKGSAYVEFLRTEAAEQALSLNGTSFMSRILKVVMKSAAPQVVSVTTWPRSSRGSVFAASRFGRVPFPRGMLSSYRARPPIKAGARSLQWKRESQVATETSGVSSNIVPSPTTTRSLTYVRAEPKPNGTSSTV